jgi:type IV pilus assembly protein PilQ
MEFIWIDLFVERSFAITTGELPIIDRNKTQTKLLLVDGEEAFISGLYYNEENVTRTGIPFLKDLPPYVLGLRYLFGSDQTSIKKRELAILIKAEILPSLRDRRMKRGSQPSVLEKMRQGFEKDLERIKPKPKEE